MLAVITVGFLAWGVRAAFSYSIPDDHDELDAGFALPAFAYSMDRGDELSLSDLNKLVFSGASEMALSDDNDVEDEDAEPEVAPKWTENLGDDEPEPEAPEQRFLVTDYRVRSGDSLRTIAARHGIAVRTLLSYNRLTSEKVLPGQKLEIPNVDGVRIQISRGEALWDITRRYRIGMKDVLEFNELGRSGDIKAGQDLFLPGARELPPPVAPSPRRSRRGELLEGRGWSWPVSDGRLSSRFGYRRHPLTGKIRFHRGIDIAAPHGTPIRAFRGGTVVFSGPRGGYGFAVDIEHENGVVTRYAHNAKNLVRVGTRVRAGDPIAKVGSTGHSTGPHIHFEVIRRGERIDPLKFLQRS